MTKKFTIFIASFFLSINFAFAKSVSIDVTGLVCEFCAYTIEKNFKKEEAVKNVRVDLDSKKVLIDFVDGQDLSNQEITDVITNNGYNVITINR